MAMLNKSVVQVDTHAVQAVRRTSGKTNLGYAYTWRITTGTATQRTILEPMHVFMKMSHQNVRNMHGVIYL